MIFLFQYFLIILLQYFFYLLQISHFYFFYICLLKISDNFWEKRLDVNKEITIPATFKKSEETGRISNFAKAGGSEEGSFEGIFFNDSDVFKIIEGASYSLQVKPDPNLKK